MVNLYTGQEVDKSKLQEAGNLYRQKAMYTPDPAKPENKPYMEDVSNAFMGGMSATWEKAARTPAALVDVSWMPVNFLLKTCGRDDLQVKSGDWLMDNPVAELYASQKKIYQSKMSPRQSMEELVGAGDYKGLARSLSLQVIENAPQQVGIIASYMAGYPGVGLAGMGMLETADSMKAGREKGMDPAMNAYNSLAKGTVEAGFENIGTMKVLKHWGAALSKSFGKKKASEVMADVFKTVFYSALGEGNEEFWTSLAQDFSDYATGFNPKAMKGSMWRAFEAGSVGAISGAAITSPAAVRVGAQSASINKMQDNIYKAMETVQEEAKPGFTPTEVGDEGKAIPVPEEIQAERRAEEEAGAAGFKFGANVAAELAPAKDNATISRLQQRLDQISDLQDRAKLAKEAKRELEPVLSLVRKGIGVPKKGEPGYEEGRGIPKQYRNAKSLNTPDIVRDQLAREDTGVRLETTSELVEFLQRLEKETTRLDEIVESAKTEYLKRAEPTVIKNRIKAIRQGIREGKYQAKEEAKEAQNELIAMMANLEAKDKAKFIRTIKNVQTQTQFARVVGQIGFRIEQVAAQTKKAEIRDSIAGEVQETKNVKKGDIKVGKYDYESNMFFKDMRRVWGLNKSDALSELGGMSLEPKSEMELIQKRALTLKAAGAEGSLALYEQVLKDIKRLKQVGKEAKDEQDYQKKLEKREDADIAYEAAGKVKGSRAFILGKIKRFYLKGFHSLYAFFNAVFGREFAENNNPELFEAKKTAATYKVATRVTAQAEKLYGGKNIIDVMARLRKEETKVTELIDKQLIKTLVKSQIIDIYNSIKNPDTYERYLVLYGQEQLDNMMDKLDPEDRTLGDILQEEVQAYREVMNKRKIEIYGEDLGIVEEYWPRSSEHVQSIFDDFRMPGATPGSVRARAGNVTPKPQDVWYVFNRSLEEGEYTRHIAPAFDRLNRIMRDRSVKHIVEEKHTKKLYQAMLGHVEALSLQKALARVDAVNDMMGKILNHWVKAKLISPTVPLRQWGSMSNYMENMPAHLWATEFVKSLKDPKKVFDYMWNTVDYLPARFHRGYTEALTRALEDAKKMSSASKNWADFLTFMVRGSDVGAIIYGGYPYMKYLQTKEGGNLSEQAAVDKFVSVTLKSQQSPFVSGTSGFQRSQYGGVRFFTAFKNTAHQYMRKIADSTISLINGDMTLQQWAKNIMIYGMIQPTLYVTTGFAFTTALIQAGALIRGDEEEVEWEKLVKGILVQMVVNPVAAVPILNSLVQAGMRKATGQKVYNIFSWPLISDMETAIRKVMKKEPTFIDYATAVGTVAEMSPASFPALTLIRIYKYLTGDQSKTPKIGG